MRPRIAAIVAVGIAVAWLASQWPRDDMPIARHPATAPGTTEPQNAAREASAPTEAAHADAPLSRETRAPTQARANPQQVRVAAPPDPSAPALEQVRYWRARARTGDAYAQCRFARAAQECAARNAAHAEWMREQLYSDEKLRAAGDALPNCRGVTEAETAGMSRSLLQAARVGHRPSQLLYAAGGGFSAIMSIRNPDELRDFREHAAPTAWAAFASGDTDAAVLLWRAYNRVDVEMLFLAAAVTPDPVKAHALDRLMLDLVPGHVAGDAAEDGLTDAQAMQAQALLRDWRAHAFAHPRPPRHGLRIETMFDWEKRAVDLCADDDPSR